MKEWCSVSKISKSAQRTKIQNLTTAAVLTALSVVLTLTLRFPLFTSFYELEFGDFPLLICTVLLGPVYGLASLFAVCLIQTLTVSSFSGIIGFIMHFVSSGAMLLIVWAIKRRISGIKGIILSSICGVSAVTLIMIPMNIWLTSVFMQLPAKAFITDYLIVCVLFNIIKSLSNIVIFHISFPTLHKYYDRLFKR